jgi:hypothetical protein
MMKMNWQSRSETLSHSAPVPGRFIIAITARIVLSQRTCPCLLR